MHEAMKTFKANLMRIAILMFLFALPGLGSSQETYYLIHGRLKDAKTGEKIIYATISVPGTGIGTVSNADGRFTLKISKALHAEYFVISHLSYATAKFKISEALGKEQTYFLENRPILLKEISIVPMDPREIVEKALDNIRRNYSTEPNIMTGFYREAIKQRREYISICEAVVDIYKSPYAGYQNDQVRIFKGHKGSNVEPADTLMVNLQGGPNVLMMLDIVKDPALTLAFDTLDNYEFKYDEIVSIDEKLNWVISFWPDDWSDYLLYFGKIYIAAESYAITRIEFNLDLGDEELASRIFVQKKPAGLVFVPTYTNYLVNYKEQDGKYYLNYVRVDLKFRCDWEKRLFKNTYTLMSELAITDRRVDSVARFPSQEVFRSWMVFTDRIQQYTDADFWGASNIIEPDNSIQEAIKKIYKTRKD